MHQSLSIILILFAMGGDPKSPSVELPKAFVFGESQEKVLAAIEPLCKKVNVREIEPIDLPTAKKSQTQIDCEEFMYAGKKRHVELVFADGKLDLIWIFTMKYEEKSFIEKFSKLYGEPTHHVGIMTFFLDHGVAVRNQPHEVMFISDRMKKPYAEFIKQHTED